MSAMAYPTQYSTESEFDHLASVPDDEAALADPKTAAVAAVADQVAQLMRVMARAKAQFIDDPNQRDWSSLLAIVRVAHDGPLRVSALAETLHCDVSTASRQVAGLVKNGLLERTPDPEDGRASLLVATEAGHAAVERFKVHRNAALVGVLDQWSVEDTATFAAMLERFRSDVQHGLGGTAPAPLIPTAQPVPAVVGTPEEN